ncbi:TPA: hypothetical protein ACJ2XI_002390 [Klebsiella quasipneumoniae]
MDDVILEEGVEMIWNGEFIPQIVIPEDDKELNELLERLGY